MARVAHCTFRRVTGGLLLLATLVAPSVGAAPFLQHGYDAARTGSVPGTGPLAHEIAMDVQLPGVPVLGAPPILLDDSAYVLVHAFVPSALNDAPPSGLTETGLFRVDLQQALVDPDPFVGLDRIPSALGSDGERFFIAQAERLAAYDRAGELLWAWPWPPLPTPELPAIAPGASELRTTCLQPAIDAGALYLACNQETNDRSYGGEPHQGSARLPSAGRLFVARFDDIAAAGAGNLAPSWLWDASDPSCFPETDAPGARVHTLAVLGGTHVLVSILGEYDAEETGESYSHSLEALDAATGTQRWIHCPRSQATDAALSPLGEDVFLLPHAITGHAETAFVLHDEVRALDLGSGALAWQHDLVDAGTGSTDTGAFTGETGIALRGRALVVQAYGSAMRLPPDAPEVVWAQPQDRGEGHVYQPLLTEDTAYMLAYGSLVARDLTDGSVVWKHTFEAPPVWNAASLEPPPPDWGDRTPSMGLADDLLVLLKPGGRLTVLGRTDASISPTLEVSTRWPAPGERVVVDLTGTAAGLGSAEGLEYSADWGDATTTAWQSEPLFEHAYASAGSREARFAVRNDAGQRSVATLTFDVGGQAPERLNFMQEAFARQNQDLTFGVLGVALALGGGVLAVGRARTMRTRLQRELDAIDALVEQSGESPGELHAMIAERRARVRGLVVDGKLDEGQGQVLERRLDEVQRQGRLGEVERLLDQLPHGLVRHVHEMLADGQVTAFERDAILALVDGSPLLTGATREEVRARIEQWFAEDSGPQ